jgi:hypothetical protein
MGKKVTGTPRKGNPLKHGPFLRSCLPGQETPNTKHQTPKSKIQNPKSKIQKNTKHQAPSSKTELCAFVRV